MNFKVKVSGIVHSLDPVINPVAYSKSTFNRTDGLEVGANGKELLFKYTNEFTTDCIDNLLTSLITESRNVDWKLEVKEVQ